jgi:hypothetical protein
MTTKKPSGSKKRPTSDMRAEYRFDYSKSRPNRFASRVSQHSVAVVLEPDVAEVFDSAESVNRFLRSAMKAMPERPPKRRAG